MRNPRHAVIKIHKHQAVGKLALQAMTKSLADDVTIEELILDAIGDSTKEHTGPTEGKF